MRILVFSDSHGDLHRIKEAVDRERSAEVIIHCGDGIEESRYLKTNYPEKAVFYVKGNCDLMASEEEENLINICTKKIFFTHGHLYGVKYGKNRIRERAREVNADILLYGHTHISENSYEDGIYIMNPGSCHGYGASYGYIDITENGEIFTGIKYIK